MKLFMNAILFGVLTIFMAITLFIIELMVKVDDNVYLTIAKGFEDVAKTYRYRYVEIQKCKK